jgi:hypothetical protein
MTPRISQEPGTIPIETTIIIAPGGFLEQIFNLNKSLLVAVLKLVGFEKRASSE